MSVPLPFDQLARNFEGEIRTDALTRTLFATDASIYQETPAAVAYPRTEADIARLIAFAHEHRIGLIPRTAGTSIAGQVVGPGIVVDVSRHFTRIIEIDATARRVRVQPGVVRNELNHALRPHGLFFGPETSTANRAMIGGMVGNNSCGSNSLVYGSTRDHVLEVSGFLSDGSRVRFGPISPEDFAARCDGSEDSLDTRIHRHLRAVLGHAPNRDAIRDNAPRAGIRRRNTGYALESLLDSAVFDPSSKRPFNLCELIAGSEGTLFFATEIVLNCVPLPPAEAALLVVHCHSVDEALQANLVALRHQPFASELIDRIILECTRSSIEHRKHRACIVGDPGAVLVVELRADVVDTLAANLAALETDLRAAKLGYAFPIVRGSAMNGVWELRRAGLGLLSNMPGDAKPVAVIEDTAVAPGDLPAYIREVDAMLASKHGAESVHYAHAGSGEIHLRPILNLKDANDVGRLRAIAEDTAALVKRYRGSLSGEHGDGRLRGAFVRRMVGDEVYALFVDLKRTWDPDGIFNPGKIVDAPPMDTSLRYLPGQATANFETFFDFSGVRGMQRAAEKCNGSGDCRKGPLAGGTMCPSYMATRNEQHTTRARANMLRNVLTRQAGTPRPLDDTNGELAAVLDLCLSCKGCKAECPSNVDMTRLKAEFLQHHHDARGVPWRTRMVASFPALMHAASRAPRLYNALVRGPLARIAKSIAGFHPARSLPNLPDTTARRWFDGHTPHPRAGSRGRVWLLADEFSDTIDARIGIDAVELLERLGYAVTLAPVADSGRTALSKGLLRKARSLAANNTTALSRLVSAKAPLVGIEPSALLSFRDEYPDLLRGDEATRARDLATHCLLFDEFIVREVDAGRIRRDDFRPAATPRTIKLHGHCHQKALASIVPSVRMLELIEGCSVHTIPSGCCGMAGAFGYERDHHAVSQAIGELVLFPAVRAAGAEVEIAAAGTSCRHQILDGTGRRARHPIEIMREAVRDDGAAT